MYSTFEKTKKNLKLIRLNKLYLSLLKTKHILCFFLGDLTQRQLTKFYKITRTKSLFFNFLYNLEFRLDFILLKSGMVITGKQARQLILAKCVLVNYHIVKSSNFQLKLGDLISINKTYINIYKQLLICNLFKTVLFLNFLKKKKLCKKLCLQHIFSYLKFSFFTEINFKTFTVYLVRKPIFNEFFFIGIFSFYDCTQLYFLL